MRKLEKLKKEEIKKIKEYVTPFLPHNHSSCLLWRRRWCPRWFGNGNVLQQKGGFGVGGVKQGCAWP